MHFRCVSFTFLTNIYREKPPPASFQLQPPTRSKRRPLCAGSAAPPVQRRALETPAYYWMEPLWAPRGRRTSIRRLAKHYQLIRPVITPAVRKRSGLTPVWKQSDNANTAAKPPRVCKYICKACMLGRVSACVRGQRPPCAGLRVCELSNWNGWVEVEGAHLEGIYCIIRSIIAAVGA